MRTATRALGDAAGRTLFTFLLLLYLLTTFGFLSNFDNESVYQTTKSLAESGSFAWQDNTITRTMIQGSYTIYQGPGGDYYSWFGPLLALSWTPYYAVGAWLDDYVGWRYPFYPQHTTELLPRLFVSLSNGVITALTAAVIAAMLQRLGYARPIAIGAALLFATGTLAWEYARSAFGEPLSALLLLAHLYYLVGYSQHRRASQLALAATMLPLLVLVKPVNLILAGATLLYLLTLRPLRRREIVWFALPLLVGGVAVGLINYQRFGNPLETGYGNNVSLSYFLYPISTGAYGLWLSPGKGLLLFSPVLLLSLIAYPRFLRSHKREGIFVLAATLIFTLLHAASVGWTGAWSWGPRYLVPIVPLLVLPLAGYLQQHGRRPVVRIFLALCILMQASLLLAFYPAFLERATNVESDFYAISLGTRHGMLVGQIKLVLFNIFGDRLAWLLPPAEVVTFRVAAEPFQHFLWVWFYRLISPKIIWLFFPLLTLWAYCGWRLYGQLRGSHSRRHANDVA